MALKRWVKDVGNILMVLVIFTEKKPIQAIKSFFARSAFLLLPASVLVIKYYPDLSRSYDPWTFQAHYVGITTNKNVFRDAPVHLHAGALVDVPRFPGCRGNAEGQDSGFVFLLLLVMTAWVLHMAQSSTALVCAGGLGACVVLGMRLPVIRAKLDRLEVYCGVALVLVLVLQVSGLWSWLTAEFAQMVGRDPTFHGRTAIWAALLKQDINPLLGAGYYSFWSVERAHVISEHYYYTLNEAHNAYLETYLNSGLIGLFLLVMSSCPR